MWRVVKHKDGTFQRARGHPNSGEEGLYGKKMSEKALLNHCHQILSGNDKHKKRDVNNFLLFYSAIENTNFYEKYDKGDN